MRQKFDFVQDHYNFVYKVIDEHIKRIENSPAVHRGSQVESPTTSARSTPCRPSAAARSVSYWHKWVSPDEIPCRDVKRPSPTSGWALPRRTPARDDSVPAARRPCVEKRKPRTSETEEPCKKQKRESQVRERSAQTEREKMPRSMSPCYNLLTRKPPCKQTRTGTKSQTSPPSSPMKDSTLPCDKTSPAVDKKPELSESDRKSPNDCKPKLPVDDSYKKTPCRKPDTTVSTEVPQATDTDKPCKQLKPCGSRPQTTVLEGKPHSKCAQTESSKTTERSDLPKEIPCNQLTHTVTAPTERFDFPKEIPCMQHTHIVPAPTTKETHKSEVTASESQQPRTLHEDKPCKRTTEVDKRPIKTEPRASSTERKCKKETKTGGHTTVQLDAPKDDKMRPNKCNQPSKPAVSDTEKPPKSDSVPVQSAVIRTDQSSAKKPCDKLKNPEAAEAVISTERKPCKQNVVEETPENRRRQRRSIKQKDCKQTSTLKSNEQKPLTVEETLPKGETAVESLKTSEARSTEKPCKNNKAAERVTETAQEGTNVTTESVKTKQPTSVIVERPCKNKQPTSVIVEKPCKNSKAAEHLSTTAQKNLKSEDHKTKQPTEKPCKKNDKITAKEQLIEERGTKKNSVVESSNTKEPASKEKPCKKKKVIESDKVTRPEDLRGDRIAENAETEIEKEKHQPVSSEKKACKEKKMQQEPLQAKEFTETDAGKYNVATEQSPSMKDMNKKKPCQQKTEAKVPVSSDKSAAVKTKRCKDKPTAESTVDKQPAEKTPADTAVFADKEKEEIDDSQFDTEQQRDEVEEPHARCLANVSDNVIVWMSETSGEIEASSSKQGLQEPCPPAADSATNKAVTQVIQATVQQVALPVHGTQYHAETSDEEGEESFDSYSSRSDSDRCGCPDSEKPKAPQKTKQDIPTASESKPAQKKVTGSTNEEKVQTSAHEASTSPKQRCKQTEYKKPEEQLTANKSPCPKPTVLTSDQSVENTTKLIGRCKQARILKLFKSKKLPCKFPLLPASSESLQSGGTGLSPYPSVEDLSDSESDEDSKNSKQLPEQLGSPQTVSVSTKDHDLSQNILDQKPLVVADTAVDEMQSDDRDIVTGKQNLSGEAVLHNLEPLADVLDSRAQTVTTESSRPKKRKDSGPQRPGKVFKHLTLPETVAEDLSTQLEWDSSDNTSSESSSEAEVPEELDYNPEHQLHAVEDGRNAKMDSGRTPPHSEQRKKPHKIEEDPHESENWDSTEESISETLPRPNVTGHVPVTKKRRQDSDNNRDNSNSCARKVSDELLDTDWSDSSSHQEFIQPQQKTSANSAAKPYFVRKSGTSETLKIGSDDQKTEKVGLVNQSSRRQAPLPRDSRPAAVNNLNTWEDFIASFKLDETD